MRFLNEFRDASLALRLLEQIRATCSRRWTIMEVCGGQTHGLLRHGIDEALRDKVELVHGPGCPVCVTPVSAIDRAVAWSKQPDTLLMTFGDMMRVPGSRQSLMQARSEGGKVRMAYSPLDAVTQARMHPHQNVVFFAVGFETTVPATALAVLQAQRLDLRNFFLLSSHVRVVPAMAKIASDVNCGIDGFLAAGHVCSVMGLEEYQPFVERYGLPVVATGFEPVDLLYGILECVRLLEARQAKVVNAYARSVRDEGNPTAKRCIEKVYEIADQEWRGFGVIEQGGYALRPEFHRWDAKHFFTGAPATDSSVNVCPSSDVLSGKLRPDRCPFFGRDCTPEQPMGAPMVSSEGACAAYFAYHRRKEESEVVAP